MGRARVLEEIRIMRFEEILDRHERGHLTQAEAGEMLGMSERTLRRWQARYREEGAAGLRDRRVGQPSPRRADEGELARAKALYAEMYDGFTVKHFHEHLQTRHGYRLGYTVTRLALQAAGLVKRAPRRGAHRRRRPRRPLPGMLLHQDAARHAWLAGRPALDLVVTLDDATSAVCSAILVEEEGTASSLRALAEVIEDHGLFCSLYTDRGSHYFHTPVAGGGVDRERPTQVGRALAQLGIEHIAAYSPQARGRSERAFRTLEDRLPKELALLGITEIDAANAWLRATYLPAHNARFAVPAEEPGTAFVPATTGQWREVLCLQETRQVGNDNCVRWKGRVLQIPKSPLRPHFVRAKVRLHEYPDGAVALFWGPHRIADLPPPAGAHDLAA
jgi:transposase